MKYYTTNILLHAVTTTIEKFQIILTISIILKPITLPSFLSVHYPEPFEI